MASHKDADDRLSSWDLLWHALWSSSHAGGLASTFENQAEDAGNVAIGTYKVVSELGLVLGTWSSFGDATAFLQGASGYEARGLRLRNKLRTPTGSTLAPDFSGLIFCLHL